MKATELKMALFKRRKKESILPEVDKYYEGERRDRVGLAWLLAVVSVAIVALFLIGLFLAGRWAYREVTGDDQAEVSTTEETDQQDLPSFDGGQAQQGQGQGDQGESSSDTNQQSGQENTDDQQGNVDAPARTDVPSEPSATPTVPTTGDSSLPSTGPESILVVFIMTSLIAGGLHYSMSKKNSRN